MKLKRFLLRYFPPGEQKPERAQTSPRPLRLSPHPRPASSPLVRRAGVILEYERRDGTRNTKIIDLLALMPE
jgi:hypothetical protein